MLRAALVALLLVLAGCQAPGAPATDTAVGGGAQTTPADGESPDSSAPWTGADPSADRLGWEDGYWHNESIDVTAEDGLDQDELDVVVARAMARQEFVRNLEFETSVPVEVVNRSSLDGGSGGGHGDEAFQRFDNAKFEALFLVGEREDSVSTQGSTRSQNVQGYYSPARDAIVIVSNSDEPRLTGERTLAHELVHALQDQHFDLGNRSVETRDAYQGQNGLIEGDATFAQQRYVDRCGNEWTCLSATERSGGGGGGGGGSHPGILFMMYFPYSDGPGFVQSLYDRGGWATVNAAYDDVPDGSPEVIYPERYSEWTPTDVPLPDRSSDEWDRVEPPGRPNYATLGQSAIAATLAYTAVDEENPRRVVEPDAVFNYRDDGSLDARDPFDYDVAGAAGWQGGRMQVYADGNETGYVWRTRWTNGSEANEFARTWTAVIRHWGGELVGDGVWNIADGEFADAFEITRTGDAVTIVNAPTPEALDGVHDSNRTAADGGDSDV